MNNYRFLIKSSHLNLLFTVIALSSVEAVRTANETLAIPQENQPIYMGLAISHASVTINENYRVDESMILDVTPVDCAVLEKAYDYLIEEGYEYQGGKEALWQDEEPSFMQPLETRDGGIYGFLKVETHYDHNLENWSFRVHAHLYPVAMGRLIDGQGGALYKVHFQDGQLYTTLEELPTILKIYERKFKDLILVLRDADPIDGLPA